MTFERRLRGRRIRRVRFGAAQLGVSRIWLLTVAIGGSDECCRRRCCICCRSGSIGIGGGKIGLRSKSICTVGHTELRAD